MYMRVYSYEKWYDMNGMYLARESSVRIERSFKSFCILKTRNQHVKSGASVVSDYEAYLSGHKVYQVYRILVEVCTLPDAAAVNCWKCMGLIEI